MAMDLSRFIQRFIEEAREHLAQLDSGLRALPLETAAPARIDALFRAAHTLKGSARMLKLGPITDTAHCLEDALGAIREGRLTCDATLADLLQRGADAIGVLVEQLAREPDPARLPPADPALCAALAAAAAPEPVPASAPPPRPAPPIAASDGLPIARGPEQAPDLAIASTVRIQLADLDALTRLMGEVIAVQARLRQRLRELPTLARVPGATASPQEHWRRLLRDLQAAAEDQDAQMQQLQDQALRLRMLPLGTLFEPARRLSRDLALSVGKDLDCVIQGTAIELDRQLIDRLADPLLHLLRNAIDHGLETPAQRRAAGKPERGRLELQARHDGSGVSIECRDDGAGLDLEAIRERAVRRHLLSAEQAATATEHRLLDLIFLPGFSTRALITDLSGRGVGLDVVRRVVTDELRGTIEVESQAGQGTCFRLRLPLSLAVMRVLLIEAGGRPFALTAAHVAELARVPATDLRRVAERETCVLRDELLPVIPLARLLGLPSPPPESAGSRVRDPLVIVIRAREEKLGLLVETLLDEGDHIIKPLPEHPRHLPLVTGLVTTARHPLIAVLHAPVLLELAAAARRQSPEIEPGTEGARGDAARAAARVWHLLVVDDSLNTREIEKDVLEAHGYRVTLAEDGQQALDRALDQAQAEPFDAILTDVEMPRLDGFGLTARLRQESAYRHTPILIITSRAREEDKRRGVQVGADAYIVKGDFDQTKLLDTLRALLG